MGFPNFDDRINPGPDILSGSYKDYIQTYKNHPAILMWEFGNEYNYVFRDHPEWIPGGVEGWYTVLEQAAEEIKKIDFNHPVSTAHGGLPAREVVAKVPSV